MFQLESHACMHACMNKVLFALVGYERGKKVTILGSMRTYELPLLKIISELHLYFNRIEENWLPLEINYIYDIRRLVCFLIYVPLALYNFLCLKHLRTYVIFARARVFLACLTVC